MIDGFRSRSAQVDPHDVRDRRGSRHPRGQRGQATVELVAMLPLLIAGALAGGQVLLDGAARAAAADAAQAGAAAMLQRRDPVDEARATVPGLAGRHVAVVVRARRVTVRVRPRRLLPLRRSREVRATADAGPPAGDGPR